MNRIEQLKNEKRAWSVCEVAAFLGYSPNYIYELIHSGKIEGWYQINGTYRFCPSKLAEWLERKFGEGNAHAHK